MKKCPRCSSIEIDTGELMTAEPNTWFGYYSNNVSKLFPIKKCTRVGAHVCLNCGYMQLFTGDLDRLKKLLKK